MGERLLNILNKPCRAGAGCFLRPILLFGFLALPPAVANAQTALPPASLPPTIAPSQVTPGASRQGSFVIPAVSALRLDVAAAPLEAPREARNLTVSLREVVIDGAFAELAMAHAAFRQEVVGTTASIAGHDRALFLSLGVDTITQHQELPFFSYQLNRDHYTSLRLGAAGWRRFSDGSYVAGELLLSRSVAGRAAPVASEPPFSEPNARPGSSKLNGRFSWHVNLDAKTSLALTMRGQSSFGKPLFVPETLSLATADGISAASPGSLITDSGITLRKELAREISLRLGTKTIAVSPYLFSAVAIGWNAKTSSNPSNLDVQALGFGTRWLHKAGSAQVRFAVEYGWCQCTAVNGAGSSRINLSIGLGF